MSIEEFFILLTSINPIDNLLLHEDELFNLIPDLKYCKGFDQKNEWHKYDVYNHILYVVNAVPRDLVIRLAALFHDIGKPNTFKLDELGVGHFYGHWDESIRIYSEFASRNNIDTNMSNLINSLIYYHDLNISKLNDNSLNKLYNDLGINGIKKLYQLKKADMLAQNEKYRYKIDEYKIEENNILRKVIK